jgi:hypothetical protein
MSIIRILGLLLGSIGLLVTFYLYRGPKWKRLNFILFSLFDISLIVVSINPNVVNLVRDILQFQNLEYGRLMALLLVSIIFLLFYSFRTKSKLEDVRIQVDKLIRSLGTADFENSVYAQERIKPIMVVIPAYNECENLKHLLHHMPTQIKGTEVGVLVVDDGSEDNTTAIAQQCGCLTVRNKINRGQGAAG